MAETEREKELSEYNFKLGQEAHQLRTTVHQLARELTTANDMIAAMKDELQERDDAEVAKHD